MTTVAWFVLMLQPDRRTCCAGRLSLDSGVRDSRIATIIRVSAVLSGIAYCISELQSRLVQAREQSSYQARRNSAREHLDRTGDSVRRRSRRCVVGMLGRKWFEWRFLALVLRLVTSSRARGRFIVRCSDRHGQRLGDDAADSSQ